MVAIKSYEADKFLQRDAAGFVAYLVFGTDIGLVSERVAAVLKALVDDPGDPFQVVRLRGEEVAADPGRLADEVNTIPLFGGRRAVLVEGTGRDLGPALTHHLAARPGTPVVIAGPGLKRDAALRKLIERARTAVAIECYPDDAPDIARLIEAEVADAGLAIEPEARDGLVALLGADRLASRAEIAKLVLYAHGQGTITLDDVEAVVADAAAQATDQLIDATFAGDLASLDLLARRVLTGPGEAGTALGAALRHAVWLHRAKLDISNGTALEQAMLQAARIGIGGGKRRGALERQLKGVGEPTLGRAVIRLGEAIGRVRREPLLARATALRVLWSIARAIRRVGSAEGAL